MSHSDEGFEIAKTRVNGVLFRYPQAFALILFPHKDIWRESISGKFKGPEERLCLAY